MANKAAQEIRLDHKIILEMIAPGAKVLDLGCGNGELLALLSKRKNCRGVGVEIDEKSVYACIAKGLTVSHGDIEKVMEDYKDEQFDYAILNESLQQVLSPQKTILDALRIAKNVIVGVPNFCHILARLQLFFLGRVPITRELPYEWYNTPNLRFLSLKDFQAFCRSKRIRIVKRKAVGLRHEIPFLRNLFAHIGIYVLEK